MAGLLTETVSAYFTISGSSTVFILDDPIRGVLDNVSYTLAGDVAVDISNFVKSVQIDRGRTGPLGDTPAGVAVTVANNHLRTFDPEYAAGVYFGNIRPGKRVTYATNGVSIFDGRIDDWDYTYPVDGDSTVTFDAADALGSLGAKEFDEWVTTAGQRPGARLTSICDRPEVQFGPNRAFDTGTSTLQDDLVTWGSNVLNYAQLVAQSDLGRLFVSKDGVLTFYGRDRVFSSVGALVFSDVAANGIFYSGISVDFGTELLYNRVSVDAVGFNKQTVVNQTSIDLYEVRSLSIPQLPLETEQQAGALAGLLLDQFDLPTSRIDTLTVDLHALEATDQTAVLALDIGSVVRVINTPNHISAALDQFALVEGMSHLIGHLFHSVTLNLTKLSDGYAGLPFILDDPYYGVLDTAAHGVLAF